MAALAAISSAAPSDASSVLIIPPGIARPSDLKLAAQLTSDIEDQVRALPDMQAGVYDPLSPSVKLAIRQHRLLPSEARDPNSPGAPFRIGAAFGADYIIYGALIPAIDDRGRPKSAPQMQLSLGRVGAGTSTVITLPPEKSVVASSPRAVTDFATAAAKQIAILMTPGATSQALTTDSAGHWIEAQKALDAGDRPTAAAEIDSSILLAPDNGKYKAGLAAMRLQEGHAADAAALYQDAATQAPFDADIRLGLGRALTAEGDYAGAIDALRYAARLAPRRPEIHLALGRALAASGDSAAALDELTAAGDSPSAVLDLVKLLRTSGYKSQALDLLTRAAPRLPADVALQEQLAASQLENGHPDGAVNTLVALIETHAALSTEGRTTAGVAANAELLALANSAEAASAENLEDLKSRASRIQTLLNGLPAASPKDQSLKRDAAAADDLLQAITIRQHPSPRSGDEGDVTVLVAQARRLLAPAQPVSHGSGAGSPSN